MTIRTVLRHELRRFRTGPTGFAIMVLTAALAAWGSQSGIANARRIEQTNRETRQARDSVLAALRHQLARPGADSAAGADAFTVAENHSALLSPTSTAALAIGQSDILPAVLGAGIMNAARLPQDRYGFENPLQLLTGRFDLALFTTLILPLLIIVLAYDVVSGERESGTLPLVLSQPVRPGMWITAKLFARMAPVVAIAVGVPMASMAVFQPAAFANPTRVLLWVALVSAYAALWCFACALLNLGRGASMRHVITLVMVWLTWVVVVPAMLQVFVSFRYPVPSRIEAVMASRENPLDYFPAIPSLAREWYARHPELERNGRSAATVVESFPAGLFLVQENMDRLAADETARIEEQLAHQERWVTALAWISPAVAFKQGLEALAGTGTARHQAFRQQVDGFRERWRLHFAGPILHAVPLGDADYDALPTFDFEEPRGVEQRAVYRSLLIGAVWLLALFALVALRTKHLARIAVLLLLIIGTAQSSSPLLPDGHGTFTPRCDVAGSRRDGANSHGDCYEH